MGAMEAIAMIGVSFVLISLYRAISCAERRYQALWHGRKNIRGHGIVKFSRKRKQIAHRMRCFPGKRGSFRT